jgi:hypothetical protein
VLPIYGSPQFLSKRITAQLSGGRAVIFVLNLPASKPMVKHVKPKLSTAIKPSIVSIGITPFSRGDAMPLP